MEKHDWIVVTDKNEWIDSFNGFTEKEVMDELDAMYEDDNKYDRRTFYVYKVNSIVNPEITY